MIRSIIFSSSPFELAAFYRKCGLQFQSLTFDEKTLYLSTNSSLCIMSCAKEQNYLGGLMACITQCDAQPFLNLSLECPFVCGKALLNISIDSAVATAKQFDWITVIRACSIEDTKSFYMTISNKWVKERHDKGPDHYALEDQGHIFEIYPCHEKHSPCLEFIVSSQKSMRGDDEPVLEGLGLKLMGGNSFIIHDPDGRRIQFVQS